MASSPSLSTLVNPLATPAQLRASASQLHGIPADLENSIRFAGARLTQAAGILLRVPQDDIARAVVLYMRFWIGENGGSLNNYGAHNISAACTYLATKLSAKPLPPRNIINVYAYLESRPSTFGDGHNDNEPKDYYVSEGTYQVRRTFLLKHEEIVLRTLGFQTHVALPYTFCINYIQTMDLFRYDSGKALAQRAVAHLNTALLSPQLLYLTHQPNALATAAIYLAAKEVGVKMPEVDWWEVFDTDREALGFLVVAMISIEGFALQERAYWGPRRVPLSVRELEDEMQQRRNDQGND